MDKFEKGLYIIGLLGFPLITICVHTILFLCGDLSLKQYGLNFSLSIIWIIAYLTGSLIVKNIGGKNDRMDGDSKKAV